VTRSQGSDWPDLEFGYDARGNRIYKKLITKTGDTSMTYYLRDATGNVMSVYKKEKKDVPVVLSESHIYGSSRLGICRPGPVGNLPVTDSVINYTRTSGSY
jgi:hypothetical protein